MTQLIAHYRVADFARFRTLFDADAEDRANAGLGLLQLWRETEADAWALFEIADAVRARDWLGGAAGVFHSQAGVLATEFHFVETV